jgi:hypothetical protein
MAEFASRILSTHQTLYEVGAPIEHVYFSEQSDVKILKRAPSLVADLGQCGSIIPMMKII